VLEIALSLKGLGSLVSFVVLVERQRDGYRERVQLVPSQRTIEIAIPGPEFLPNHWRA
jgi:hypothetical protein